MRRRWMKWTGVALMAALVSVVVLFAVAWAVTDTAMRRPFEVKDAPLAALTGAQAIARGRHLYLTRGCADCHGASATGQVLFDEPAVAKVVPTNLTHKVREPAYTDDALAAAIRHGVRHDGTPLLLMPAGDYADLDDADTGALIAYLRSLPRGGSDPGPSEVRPLGRVLYALGKLPLFPAEALDHTPRQRQAPVAAPTPEYGRYIAQACTGCHGSDFAGGLVVAPGKPPSANLTPHADGLAKWSEPDFLHLMHTGLRPDGRAVDPFMPWPAYSRMDEVELQAIWAYLRTLPPVPGRATARR